MYVYFGVGNFFRGGMGNETLEYVVSTAQQCLGRSFKKNASFYAGEKTNTQNVWDTHGLLFGAL